MKDFGGVLGASVAMEEKKEAGLSDGDRLPLISSYLNLITI